MEKAADITGSSESQSFFVSVSRNEIIKMAGLGIAVGLLIPLISFLLERFFIVPVFCQSPDSFGICASGGLVAYYVATGIVSAMAIALMASWQVFRPILIAIATAAALWGLKRYMGELATDGVVEYFSYSALLFGLCYILFYWVMRLRPFIWSVLITVFCVIFIRWAVLS